MVLSPMEKRQKRVRGNHKGDLRDFLLSDQVHFMETLMFKRRLKETGNEENEDLPSKWEAPY